MEPLKEMFNSAFYTHLAEEFKKTHKPFDPKLFVKKVTENMGSLSLNERMRNTSLVLKDFLPDDYFSSIEIMKQVIPHLKPGYTNLVFPDYVGLFGLNNFNVSMDALKYFTAFGSSEFAIRIFLKNDFEKTIKTMSQWARDKNHHVRRLASEGSRPRLPWSFKLDEVIKKPESTHDILDCLKADSELYVKKSVANHLNDISKDNSEYMIRLLKSWDKSNEHTAWIVKHASRTLIKKGNAQSLSVFNFEKNPRVEIKKINLQKEKIKLGDVLCFDFTLISKKNKPQKLVVDYVIHYQKKTGQQTPKVFKLKELSLKPNQQVSIAKKQVFKDFTTRKHYAGVHRIEIMVNGKLVAKKNFTLAV